MISSAKIVLTINQVNLTLRYQGTISFQLYEGNRQNNPDGIVAESEQSYQLQNGVCKPGERLTASSKFQYENQEVIPKELRLVLMFTKNNGNASTCGELYIPINSSNFNQQLSQQEGLLSCTDKNAFIKYTISVKQLESAEISRNSVKMSNLRGSSNQIQSHIEKTGFNYQRPNDDSMKLSVNSYRNRTNSNYRNKSRSSKKDTLYSPRPQNPDGSFKMNKYNHHSNSTLSIHRLEDNGKISDEHYKRLKLEVETQIAENQGLREQIMNLQWRQRELNQNCRQSKDEVQKMREKLHHSELLIIQYQSQLGQRQAMIREMQSELRSIQQKNSDNELTIGSLNKKIEYKQDHFKEQLNSLTAKYNSSQQQKQKSFYEMNNMLQKLQTIEREHQVSNKQKDMAHMSEKTQLLKKIEQLNREIEKLKEQNQSKGEEYSDLILAKKRLEGKLQQSKRERDELKTEIKNLENLLNKQQQTSKNMNRELISLQNAANELRNAKHEIQELEKELFNYKKELETITKASKSQTYKNKQLEDQMFKKSQEIIQLQSKNNSLNNELSSLKKHEIELKKDIQFLNNGNAQCNTKIEQYKNRYEQLQNSYRELENKLEETKNYQHRAKQQLLKEIQEYKHKNSKIKNSATDLESKVRDMEDEINSKDKKIKGYEAELEKLKIELNGIKTQQRLLNEEQLSSKTKEKQLSGIIEIQKKTISEQLKEIENLQNYSTELEQSMSMNELKNSERITKEENMNRYLEGKVSEKQNEIKKLQSQLKDHQVNIEGLSKDIAQLQEQLDYYKESQLGARKTNNQFTAKIDNLTKQNSKLVKQLETQSNRLEKKSKQYEDLSLKWKNLGENASGIEKQFNQYKNQVVISLSQFIKQLQSIIDGSPSPKGKKQPDIKLFPDNEIGQLQVGLLGFLRETIQAYNSQVTALQTENDKLQKNLANSSETQLRKIKNLEKSVGDQQIKNKNLTAENSRINTQKLELKNKLDSSEGTRKISQKQNAAIIAQKDKQISKLENEIKNSSSSSSAAIKNMKDELFRVRNQLSVSVEKSKQLTRENSTIEKELADTKNTLKNTELSTNTQIQKLTKQLSKKQEELKNSNSKLSDKTKEAGELSRENKKINEELRHYTMASQSSNKNVKGLQKRIEQLTREIHDLNEQWDQERMLYIPIGEKFDKLKVQITKCTNSTTQIEKNSAKLLEVSKKRARDDQIIRQSAGQVLRDVQTELMKLKKKILNKYIKLFDEQKPIQNPQKSSTLLVPEKSRSKVRRNSFYSAPTNEKQQVLYDFKSLQQRIEGAIRSYHIMVV